MMRGRFRDERPPFSGRSPRKVIQGVRSRVSEEPFSPRFVVTAEMWESHRLWGNRFEIIDPPVASQLVVEFHVNGRTDW